MPVCGVEPHLGFFNAIRHGLSPQNSSRYPRTNPSVGQTTDFLAALITDYRTLQDLAQRGIRVRVGSEAQRFRYLNPTCDYQFSVRD